MTREQYINDIFSTYSLISILSNKNNCCVFRLRHKKLGKDLILRSYSSVVEAYEKLVNVAHENLPFIYDSIVLDDGQIILEEFIEGICVSEVMDCSSYQYSGARRVIKAICHALTVIHERGIVHRDIKPENIMINKDGRVILVDFNAARSISAASKDTVIMGTVGYASPEQLGIAQSDARTDIYAVGVLLNVMLTGKHPSEVLAKGRAGRIVRRCTSVNPNERYQSSEKLAKIL